MHMRLPGTRERKETQASTAEGGVALPGSVLTAFQKSHYNSGEVINFTEQ